MRAVLLALSIVLVAPTAHAAAAGVRIEDFRFKPDYVRIDPGEKVDWLMAGAGPHTVTSSKGAAAPFDSGPLDAGGSFQFAFAQPGRYPYHCTIHDSMTGVVQVGPDTTAPKLTKLFPNVRAKRVYVAFRVSETARVSASVARAGKPRRKLRGTGPVRLVEGQRSLFARIGGLRRGRYRVKLTATDPAGNSGSATARFKIPKPATR